MAFIIIYILYNSHTKVESQEKDKYHFKIQI